MNSCTVKVRHWKVPWALDSCAQCFGETCKIGWLIVWQCAVKCSFASHFCRSSLLDKGVDILHLCALEGTCRSLSKHYRNILDKSEQSYGRSQVTLAVPL